MTAEEFKILDSQFRSIDPTLFQMAIPDSKASADEITHAEQELGIQLSSSYRSFLQDFGGGEYGLVIIFSANPNSEWYLPFKQNEATQNMPNGLLAFSDDFAGGYYVFSVVDGQAEEAVQYWNTDGGVSETEFSNIFEFVARNAYEPA